MAKKENIDRGILTPKEKSCLNWYVYMLHNGCEDETKGELPTS